MTILDYLVMEIEKVSHIYADIRGETVFIWCDGFEPTEHKLELTGDKPLSILSNELIHAHWKKDKSILIKKSPLA